MRLGEICAIRWDDLDGASILVRDRKDPKRKAATNKHKDIDNDMLHNLFTGGES
jgi:integrase